VEPSGVIFRAMEIVIAGGGVAGLEGLLALHRSLGDRARLVLIAPDSDFTYRPMAVAEPFGLGHAHRVPLRRFVNETGAELMLDAVTAVDDADRHVQLADGGSRGFDALLLAPGGRAVTGVPGATTWWPAGDSETYGGLLRDLEEGYSKRLAIVVPPGAVWPLPAYELALMTAGEARGMGRDDLKVIVVTPEHAPLSLFGDEAGRAVTEELNWAGVELRTGAVGRKDGGELVLEPSGERLPIDRVFAVPRIVGPVIEGLPCDDEGFLRAGDDARVEGAERTWAAGDGVVSPVKFGGLATHQARRAVAAIAGLAGVDVPDPGEPVLHGRLLVGHRTRRLTGKGGAEGAPLWWPHGKVAGEYLPRWLAEHGVAPPAAEEPPADDGVTVQQPLSAMRGVEAQYLFDLARQFRTDDPAIASLGRRMREARER
jgi:sulfide:quinone oxidoreductase